MCRVLCNPSAVVCGRPPQVKLFLGVAVPRDESVHLQLRNLAEAMGGSQVQELLMGATWLALLVAFKQLGSKHK